MRETSSKSDLRVIKRYTNRKLYDMEESRYVTLQEVANLVKEGQEIKIVDNKSKEDLTNVTLAQIIFEEEKKTSTTPRFVLKEMIRHGGDRLQAFISHELNPRVSAIRAEAESAVAKVFKREGGSDVALASVPTSSPETSSSDRKPSPLEQAREFVRASRQTLEDWQGSLDERVGRAVKSVVGLPNLHLEVRALSDKLAELEKKLEEYESGE